MNRFPLPAVGPGLVAGFALALVSLGACTAANPSYDPTGGQGGPMDLAVFRAADLGTVGDLAIRPPDLLPPLLCGPGGAPNGARACSGNLAQSGTCKGDKHSADRDCPLQSPCQGGYCAIPPAVADSTQGGACSSEAQCYISQATYTQSCVPFIVSSGGAKTGELHCAERMGNGAAGQPCKRGADCRSGFCLGTGYCFRACAGKDTDCPKVNNVQMVCRAVTLQVEGTAVVAASCVLP